MQSEEKKIGPPNAVRDEEREEAGDVEARGDGVATNPNLVEDCQQWWAFVRKVYLILAAHFLLTASIIAAFNYIPSDPNYIPLSIIHSGPIGLPAFLIVFHILPLIAFALMLYFRKRHPINMVLLGVHTVSISLYAGLLSASLNSIFLLEAAFVTTAVLLGLSLFTLWAAKRGHDFEFLPPFLCISSLVAVGYVTMKVFHPLKLAVLSLPGCIATIAYSAVVIYDTGNLIKHHKHDEYTCAVVSLYLSIIKLFIAVFWDFCLQFLFSGTMRH